jgi:hypothetical protein
LALTDSLRAERAKTNATLVIRGIPKTRKAGGAPLNAADLRSVMEKFGTVKELNLTDATTKDNGQVCRVTFNHSAGSSAHESATLLKKTLNGNKIEGGILTIDFFTTRWGT